MDSAQGAVRLIEILRTSLVDVPEHNSPHPWKQAFSSREGDFHFRYDEFSLDITQSCTSFPPLQAIGPVVLWILVDILMILRIRALYRAQKSVGVTVIFIWLVAACVVIPVTVYCFRLSRPVPAPPPFDAIAGCVVPSINFKKIGMIKIAVMNQFNTAINAADLVVSCGGPSTFPYVDLLQFWLGAFYSYAGCHLILHLRSASSSLTSLTSFADCADLEVRYPAKGKDSESPLNDDTCTMISLSARYGDALHNSTMGAESDIVQASRTSENDESSSQHISTAV
ncbi:hypothetical protein JR316_0012465 [Psilocybe cubensis]|uniref:Uncharacterized protein n=1 Tax=Psilocybe cubensis TaxID=181762 RepID=A0ACB8GJW2_PSICU|nr:hypothetical protein JR316_0012465 [Psilocybe cubensis]KAH9475354.1 hypothetical protein JR316_0012465 [Psilocybe cubensis]